MSFTPRVDMVFRGCVVIICMVVLTLLIERNVVARQDLTVTVAFGKLGEFDVTAVRLREEKPHRYGFQSEEAIQRVVNLSVSGILKNIQDMERALSILTEDTARAKQEITRKRENVTLSIQKIELEERQQRKLNYDDKITLDRLKVEISEMNETLSSRLSSELHEADWKLRRLGNTSAMNIEQMLEENKKALEVLTKENSKKVIYLASLIREVERNISSIKRMRNERASCAQVISGDETRARLFPGLPSTTMDAREAELCLLKLNLLNFLANSQNRSRLHAEGNSKDACKAHMEQLLSQKEAATSRLRDLSDLIKKVSAMDISDQLRQQERLLLKVANSTGRNFSNDNIGTVDAWLNKSTVGQWMAMTRMLSEAAGKPRDGIYCAAGEEIGPAYSNHSAELTDSVDDGGGYDKLLTKLGNYSEGLCPEDRTVIDNVASALLRCNKGLSSRSCYPRVPDGYVEPSPYPTSLWDGYSFKSQNIIWTDYNQGNGSSLCGCSSFACARYVQVEGCDRCFDLRAEKTRWEQEQTGGIGLRRFMEISRGMNLRIGADLWGRTGTFAAKMAEQLNCTILTRIMNHLPPHHGAEGSKSDPLPFAEAIAFRGLVPLQLPAEARLPFFDRTLDIVRVSEPVPRLSHLHFRDTLFESHRVLRQGGLLWLNSVEVAASDLHLVLNALLRIQGVDVLLLDVAEKDKHSALLHAVLKRR